jgi:hypothetical protein
MAAARLLLLAAATACHGLGKVDGDPLQPLQRAWPGDARSRQLQADVDATIAAGSPATLRLSGRYNFSRASLVVLGATDLTLEAARDTLLLFTVWRVPCTVVATGGPCHGDSLAPDDCCATGTCGPDRECVGWSSGVNITNSVRVVVRGVGIDYDESLAQVGMRQGGGSGAAFNAGRLFTYHNFNSSQTTTEDLSIFAAPFMAITNLNGEGGHVFRRVRFVPPTGWMPGDGDIVAGKDGIHESDVRRGMVLEDSQIHGTGDDFFNLHTTLMVTMRCEIRSCLMINPHVNRSPRNTIYASNSVLETVLRGDRMSFYPLHQLEPAASATVSSLARVTDPALLEEAALFANQSAANATNGMLSFATLHIDDLWVVNFEEISSGAVARNLSSAVSPTTLISIDTINSSGAVFRNNSFSRSNCNCGRWKSSGGVLQNNTFAYAHLHNLELCPLPNWFEGPIEISNVTIRGNVFIDEGKDVIHPGPTAREVVLIDNRYLPSPVVPADSILDEWLVALSESVPLSEQRSYPFEFHYNGVSSDQLLPEWAMTSRVVVSSGGGRRLLYFVWHQPSRSSTGSASGGMRVGVNVTLFTELPGAVDQVLWFDNNGSVASGVVTLVNSLRVSWHSNATSDAVQLHARSGVAVDAGTVDYQLEKQVALHTPGSTGIHTMRLVNKHGYFSGTFSLAPTAGITNESACVTWCNLTSDCVAVTWSPRPSHPCVVYTTITSTVVPFSGCDNWVKQQPHSQKNFTCLSGMPNKGTQPFWQLEWKGRGVSLSLGWIGQWAASFARDDDGATTVQIGFGGDGAGGGQDTSYPAFRVPPASAAAPTQQLRMVRVIILGYKIQRPEDSSQLGRLHYIGLNMHRRFVLEHLAPRHSKQPFPLVSTISNVANVAWHAGTDAEISEFIDSASQTNAFASEGTGGIEEM